MGFQQFLAQDGDVTLELVEQGKEHIKREKRRRQRLAESATRRRDFANRFGDIEANSRGKIKVHFQARRKRGGGHVPPLLFGRSVNPISTRVDTLSPPSTMCPPPDFQTLRLP